MSSRSPDRVSGVARRRDQRDHGGDRRGGSAARARGHTRRVVGVARISGESRADRLDRTEREFSHVRFRKDDRTGVSQAFDQRRVFSRAHVLQ